MRLGATLSAGLHALVITLAWFGLPHLRADPPVLDDIVFVKLAELGDVTNVPPEAPEPIKTKPKADPIAPKREAQAAAAAGASGGNPAAAACSN